MSTITLWLHIATKVPKAAQQCFILFIYGIITVAFI